MTVVAARVEWGPYSWPEAKVEIHDEVVIKIVRDAIRDNRCGIASSIRLACVDSSPILFSRNNHEG